MLFVAFKNNQVSIRDIASTIRILGKDFQKYFQEMIQYEEAKNVRHHLQKLYNQLYPKK